jgi:hypothetical protein
MASYAPFPLNFNQLGIVPHQKNGGVKMKVIFKNNCFAFLVYLFIVGLNLSIMLLLTVIFNEPIDLYNKTVQSFQWLWILVFFLLGYLLSGRLFVKTNQKFKNFVSFIILILVCFAVWIYCQFGFKFLDLEWSYYFITLPFSWPVFGFFSTGYLLKYRSMMMLLLALSPSFLFWLGMESRKNIIKINIEKAVIHDNEN